MFDAIKKFIPVPIKQSINAVVQRRVMQLPEGPRAFVFLSADYGNIGDLAISAAQRQFLAAALPDHAVVTVPISTTREVMQSIHQQIASGDLVTIIGGGNMGSLYSEIETLRQRVIRTFPRNRIVCFPQSLDWDETSASTKALEQIVRVYSRHPDIHIFARESTSFHKLRELFAERASVHIGICPDIVLSATATGLGAHGDSVPNGALLCLRDDRERSLDGAGRLSIQQALTDAGLHIKVTDTDIGGGSLSPEHSAQLIADKLTQFQSAQLVVTDRLHGMILAALAGTPCLALPNANHKIQQTWVDWLAGVPQLRFLAIAELAEAGLAVEGLLAAPRHNPQQVLIDPVRYADLRAAL